MIEIKSAGLPQSAIDEAVKKGFTWLGGGLYKDAFLKNGEVTLVMSEFEPGSAYLNRAVSTVRRLMLLSKKLRSPHLPRFLSGLVEGELESGARVFQVKVEFLETSGPGTPEFIVCSNLPTHVLVKCDTYADLQAWMDSKENLSGRVTFGAEKLNKTYPMFFPTLFALAKKCPRGQVLDHKNSANIMNRRDVPVFVDPLER